MTTWGYVRLDPGYAANLVGYVNELKDNTIAPVDEANIRFEFSRNDRAKLHNRHAFNRLLKDEAKAGDVIVVVKLSHLSMEFGWIAELVTRIGKHKLDFVALNANVDTRLDADKYLFTGMKTIAKLLTIRGIKGNEGGDGGGNGGC